MNPLNLTTEFVKLITMRTKKHIPLKNEGGTKSLSLLCIISDQFIMPITVSLYPPKLSSLRLPVAASSSEEVEECADWEWSPRASESDGIYVA